ncbi:MAG: hypothetical protein ACRDWI_07835 [Jiangellaceae bacterium]
MPTRTIENVLADQRAIVDAAGDRLLSDDEAAAYEALEGELAVNRRDGEIRARQTAYETPVDGGLAGLGAAAAPAAPRPNPLGFTAEALDGLQAAIESRTEGRFAAGMTREELKFFNATLSTSTYGAPREWGANVLDGPRLLHVAAGVPRQPITAVLAQFPSLTLPTAAPGVGEGVSLAEYASSTAGSVTLARFGRWTDLSVEALIGADAGALIGMHQLGIALDLDKLLVDAVNTAAGAAVPFNADVVGQIRKSMATVIAATAAADPARLMIMAHPDNVPLLQDVTPVGGLTIAEPFQKFSGATVYASTAVPTGFMLTANLQVGVRFFEARGALSQTDLAPKSDITTVATSLIGGYGITLTTGFVIKNDVVTP